MRIMVCPVLERCNTFIHQPDTTLRWLMDRPPQLSFPAELGSPQPMGFLQNREPFAVGIFFLRTIAIPAIK